MQADRLLPLIGNRYQLEAQLGQGGMGAVYRAYDYVTGDEVALKRVLQPTQNLQFATRLSLDSAESGSSNLRIALAQEFQTLASLLHPNVIRVLDYGFDSERQPYLAMVLLHDRRTLLEAGKDAPLAVKIDLLVQTLQALAYLHRRGIIHRDLKPDNVAVVSAGGAPLVRVLDFGLALSSDYLQTGAPGLAGTLAYIAPELMHGDLPTESSDLYAVGVMAYELFAGEHPFNAPTTSEMINRVLKSEPDLSPLLAAQPAPEALSELPLTSLSEIVARLLAKHPSERYSDAYTVIADLCAATGVPVPEESAAIRESFLQAARFVGRAAEFDQLREALGGAYDGHGSLWLVGGESGVGKSRLLDELRTRALIIGVLALRGQEVASGGQPYDFWHDPLRRLILSSELSSDEASVLSTILPDISALFDDVPPFRGTDVHQRLTRVITDLFRRQREPIVLLLEDLHWADESLDVLRRLAPYVEDLPLLIVGSYRDDERPDLPRDLPQAHLLSLTRLAPDAIAELTMSMLGDSGLQDELVGFLQRETEGNAFFLVETVRALAEEAGSLSGIGRRSLPQHLIAGGVRQVIWRRIRRVPEQALGLLKCAAVVGRDLDRDLLQFVVNHRDYGPIDLDDWLTTCANRAIFDYSEGRWRFAHDKLREALLEALTPDEWTALHRQAAEAIEAVYADDLDANAVALADHWKEAGDERKESQYTRVAAEQTLAHCAYHDAQRLFSRALEIRAYAYADDPAAAEARLHWQLGYTLYVLNVYDPAREQHRQSLALYRALDDQRGIADALTGLGECDMRQGLLDQAEAYFQETLVIRQALNLAKDIGYSYMNLGVIETSRDHMEKARDFFQASYEYMQVESAPRDLARAMNNLAGTIDVLGEKERALQLHQQALAIREREQDLSGICYSQCNLGMLQLDLGHADEARTLLEQSLRLARQLADRLATATILTGLGDVYSTLGDYDTARTCHREALDLRVALEDRFGIVASLRSLGEVAREQGDDTTALFFYMESLARAREFQMETSIPQTLQALARLLMLQAKRRQALKLLAFVRAHRDEPDVKDDYLIQELEMLMPPNAFASVYALGEALTQDEVLAKISAGDLEF